MTKKKKKKKSFRCAIFVLRLDLKKSKNKIFSWARIKNLIIMAEMFVHVCAEGI